MAILQPINQRAFYIPGANNLGIVLNGDGGAIAIDTGIDKDTGRSIRKALDEAGLHLVAIISTHHHADHIGGNDYLVRAYPGIAVCAPPLEAALIAHPELEPIYLSGGAAALPALKTKWLMARGVPVTRIIDGSPFDVGGVTFEIVPLPGHSMNQIGLAVDSVCFAADGFFGPETLAKHGIPFAHDIGAQLASLQRLAARGEQFFLPGHGALTTRDMLEEALATNEAAITRASQIVLSALEIPAVLPVVGGRVQQAFGLAFAGMPQYAVFISAVAAHLAFLETRGLAHVALTSDGLVWEHA